ncbi:cytochrome-c oxidase [Bacillus salacetis]|uniref:cytochrome-c oxidase n=1 Tax=Bacillus salacetis TaxID=2315464 RepID=UPI003BA38BDE
MGARLLKISVFYLIVGVGLGMYMSIVHNFGYTGAHAHINLLGWASLALAGLIYVLFPAAAESTLGKIHFWLHNIGLPIMCIGLFIVVHNQSLAVPIISIGSILATLGIISFFINVLKNVNAADVKDAYSNKITM